MHVLENAHSRYAVRQMRPDDLVALETVFAGMSDRSRLLRFLAPTPRMTGSIRRALLDLSDRHVAYVAETVPERAAIGIGRYVVTGPGEVEVALSVVDAWQRQGVGRLLLDRVVREAADAGMRNIVAAASPGNPAVLALARARLPHARVEVRDGIVWLSAAVPVGSRAAA
jgi:GNAT superfamily N-acetyltransferase